MGIRGIVGGGYQCGCQALQWQQEGGVACVREETFACGDIGSHGDHRGEADMGQRIRIGEVEGVPMTILASSKSISMTTL